MSTENYEGLLEESADNLKRAQSGLQHGGISYGPSSMSEPANPAPVIFQMPVALEQGAEYCEALVEEMSAEGGLDSVRRMLGRPTSAEKLREQVPGGVVQSLYDAAQVFDGGFTYGDFEDAVLEWDRVHDDGTYKRVEEPGEDFEPLRQISDALEEVSTLQDRTPL